MDMIKKTAFLFFAALILAAPLGCAKDGQKGQGKNEPAQQGDRKASGEKDGEAGASEEPLGEVKTYKTKDAMGAMEAATTNILQAMLSRQMDMNVEDANALKKNAESVYGQLMEEMDSLSLFYKQDLDKEDVKKRTDELIDQAKELQAAIKGNDSTGTLAAFKKVNQTCIECHWKYMKLEPVALDVVEEKQELQEGVIFYESGAEEAPEGEAGGAEGSQPEAPGEEAVPAESGAAAEEAPAEER